MNVFEELENIFEEQGVVQISGGVLKDHTGKRLIPNDDPDAKPEYRTFPIKANTTVEQYCNRLGEMHNVSGKDYALELLAIEKAIASGKATEVVGECRRCWTFMYKNEEHVCDETRVKEQQENQKLWASLQKNHEQEIK